jgi:hypothetical protein
MSRWALLACVGWACLNPQPDTDPLDTGGAGASSNGVSPDQTAMSGVGGGAGGSSSSSAGAGGGASTGAGGGAGSGGSAGSGGLEQPDGGVPRAADAGVEVGDAAP